jgi:hypothetical protein
MEAANAMAKTTAPLREFTEHLGLLGATALGASAAIALPLKSFVEEAATVDEAMRHRSTALDPGAAGMRELGRRRDLPRCRSNSTMPKKA